MDGIMDGVTQEDQSQATLLAEFRGAVAADLRLLALLHSVEPGAELLNSLKDDGFPNGLGLRLRSPQGTEALSVLEQALADLPESIDTETLDPLAVDFANIYLIHAYQASPYESVWLDDDHLERQEAMFRVREDYRRYGLMAADRKNMADDHLALQLQFLAHLLELAPEAEGLRETARFMDEHLLRWLTPFAKRVASRCETPYFAGLGMLTAVYAEELRELLVEILDQPRPTAEEIDKHAVSNKDDREAPVLKTQR